MSGSGRTRSGSPLCHRESEHRKVAVQLEPGDLAAVFVPFLALVAQEEVEDVLAEDLRNEVAALHHLDGLVEVGRQGLDAQCAALGGRKGPDLVLGTGRELVVFLDALEASTEDEAERQV